jgi:amidase/6-aminohexanoate-cyclic-dimer hydrolase
MAHAATLSGEDYLAAIGRIHAYGREMAAAFEGMDVLLSPTLAEPPAKVGRFGHASEDYVAYRLGPEGVWPYSPFCTAFNASGQPAATLPLHWSAEGLPVGVHLAAALARTRRSSRSAASWRWRGPGSTSARRFWTFRAARCSMSRASREGPR